MSFRLVLNPITCVAHGMCAELFPERITLDDWGYPIIDKKPTRPAHTRARAGAGGSDTHVGHCCVKSVRWVPDRRETSRGDLRCP
jgi:ferredoxin